MKRLLGFAAVVVVVASGVLAQNNPFVGTWKLNLAKSKFTSPPREEMFTVQMVGDQDQVTVTGTAAVGSPISMKYEVPDKGGTGKILTGGPYDAVSGKRIDENTYETSLMKDGKEISHHHLVVSKDGKTMTDTAKGTNAQGNPVSGVEIFEKQ